MAAAAQPLPADAAKFVTKGDPEALYEVLVEVGQGSFGAVYKARHKQTGNAVAIKQMKRTNDDEWNDILKEIRFITSLDHENIVKHIGSYVKDGTIWMVMEFCIGSAADMIDLFRKPFSEPEISAILHSIVPALAYLHERKRIHRDMKAANILLNSRGQVKLGDFGSAAVSDPANTFVGTPCWMAPEVIMAMESGLYTSRADVWGVGITAIEMAEKKPPLFEMNTMSALYHIPQNDPPTLAEAGLWSENFHDFLRKCLQKKAEDRAAAAELVNHPFLAGVDPRMHVRTLKALVRRCKTAAAERDAEQSRKIDEISGSEVLTGHARSGSESSDGQVSDHGRTGSDMDGRRRRFSAMLSVDEEDLSTALNDFHLNDETADEPPLPAGSSPKMLRREPSVVAMDKQREKELIRAQLNALKYLQARQQKQIKQIDKTHEQQMADLRKQGDKEADVEAKLQTAEVDKLHARQKAALVEHNKQQAQALKAFLKKQESEAKARKKEHEASLKKGLKDMEKAQKAEKEAAPKDQHKALKDRFKQDLVTYKTNSEAQFAAAEARQLASEQLAFKRQQLEAHQAFELTQLNDLVQALQAQRDQTRSRRLRQLETEASLAVTQRKEHQSVLQSQQNETHKTELEQLELQLKKEDKDLRKKHQAETKAQPKQMKTIRSSIQREMTDTVKVTKQRHSVMQKQLLETAPKEEQKRLLIQQRREFEAEMTKTSSDYERKIAESMEKEAHDLEVHRQHDEEDLRMRQDKDRALMAKMQRLRRETLEASHAKELADMQSAHKVLRDSLEASLQAEQAQFNNDWAQKRSEMKTRHAGELAQLQASAHA